MKPFSRELQEKLIRIAQREAAKSLLSGDKPFGALLVNGEGVVCFRAHCTQLRDSDRIAHAEINLIRKACKKLHCQSLADLVLVINAEPCSMCLSAAIKSGITYIYYGARMGQGANPYLLACDLVKLSRTKITLYPDILRNECEAQIAQARLQLKN